MGCLTLLTEALRDFGTAKQLAIVVGCSEKTAQKYLRGETYPDVLTVTRLMARSRAVADAMLRLAGLDDLSMDIEQARLLRSLADLQAKRLAAHEALEQAAASLRADARPARRVARGPAGGAYAAPRRAGEAP